MDSRTYREKLLDPRWQRVRLRVFARDAWRCIACGEDSRTLHVHHLRYEAGRDPWESPPSDLATLCDLCHGCISPTAADAVRAQFGLGADELRDLAEWVEAQLIAWIGRQRDIAVEARKLPAAVEVPAGTFVSSCPDWRKLRPRAGRAWTLDEDEALLLEFEAGLSLEEIALLRGRGAFGVEVRLYKLGRKSERKRN